VGFGGTTGELVPGAYHLSGASQDPRSTNLPGARYGDGPSQDTLKIWRKFDGCVPIGYSLLVRIASNSPIPAQIRLEHELARQNITAIYNDWPRRIRKYGPVFEGL
jgi:hypothetical protein